MFKALCVSGLLLRTAYAQVAQSVSDVCVFNHAAFVLKWHLKDLETNTTSEETTHYPVGQVRCIGAESLANMSNGHTLVPVVHAVLGKDVTPSETVVFDGINVSEVTYVCRGTTLHFSCKPGPAPLPATNVTENIGEFMIGFAEGVGNDTSFTDCLQDSNSTYQKMKGVVGLFKSGINHKKPKTIVKAFKLIGEVLKNDFAAAIADCSKDATEFAAKIKDLARALSGDAVSIIKIIHKGAVRIFHDRHDLTHDCKSCAADWHAGDFIGSGRAVGDVVKILLGGIILEQPEMMVV